MKKYFAMYRVATDWEKPSRQYLAYVTSEDEESAKRIIINSLNEYQEIDKVEDREQIVLLELVGCDSLEENLRVISPKAKSFA